MLQRSIKKHFLFFSKNQKIISTVLMLFSKCYFQGKGTVENPIKALLHFRECAAIDPDLYLDGYIKFMYI
jgi:hypothetical protein